VTHKTMESLLRNLLERVERLEARFDHAPSDRPSNEEETGDAIPGRWADRLTFAPYISKVSPVVKGTFVTVKHVVSLIVDGWTYADIIRAHPNLTESDIRTCLAYDLTRDEG
jgi:uncharacterized protein (DUF433 family)